jgi:hypothetical protein
MPENENPHREEYIKGKFNDPERSPEENERITLNMRENLKPVEKQELQNNNESALDFNNRLTAHIKEQLGIIKSISDAHLIDTYSDVLAEDIRRSYWAENRRDITQRTIGNMAHSTSYDKKTRDFLNSVIAKVEDQDVQDMKRSKAA